MRSWKVRQLRLQLEFLLFFFFFIPYSADNFSLASVPTHHGTMPSWCSVSWAFKIFPSSSTKYIPTICYTKAPRLVIQCSQGCQPQTDYSRQWGVTRRNITRMRREVWDTEAQRTWVLSSPLYHLSHLLIVSLLILSVWPSHSCEWSYLPSNRSPVNVSNPGHSSYPSPNHSVAALIAFETNMFQVTLAIFLPPTTPSWWKASSFTLNTFLFLTPQI